MSFLSIAEQLYQRFKHKLPFSPYDFHPLQSLDRQSIVSQQQQEAITVEAAHQALLSWDEKPSISIITPVYNPPENILREMIESILSQHYPFWELCLANDASTAAHVAPILEEYASKDSRIQVTHLKQNKGISGASNAALSMARNDFICLVDHDDLLLPQTLWEVANLLQQSPSLDYVYTDSAIISMKGEVQGYFFKPSFNRELFLCHNWVGQLSTIRRKLVEEVGGWVEGRDGQDYDLFLRCFENTKHVAHLPKVLYYWRQAPNSISVSSENKPHTHDDQAAVLKESVVRLGIEAEVETIRDFMFYVKRPLRNRSRISWIVYLPRDVQYIRFLEALTRSTEYPDIEFLCLAERALTLPRFWKNDPRVRFIPYNTKKTLTHNLNRAATEAEGYYLGWAFQLFLPKSSDWMEYLLEQAQRPEVGMVNGKLLNNEQKIESAGVILSEKGPLNLYRGEAHDAIGDTNSLISLRSYLLLTGNTSIISKNNFIEVGGFDEVFEHSYFDYDLCLRLHQHGKINMYTPFATAQLQYKENFYRDYPWTGTDYSYFHGKWKLLYGKDENFNFTLQNALVRSLNIPPTSA